jgi:hypothetical protein
MFFDRLNAEFKYDAAAANTDACPDLLFPLTILRSAVSVGSTRLRYRIRISSPCRQHAPYLKPFFCSKNVGHSFCLHPLSLSRFRHRSAASLSPTSHCMRSLRESDVCPTAGLAIAVNLQSDKMNRNSSVSHPLPEIILPPESRWCFQSWCVPCFALPQPCVSFAVGNQPKYT